YFIKKFKYCWIPDFKENGLAGDLSHPKKIPSNAVYIGPLSRFKFLQNVEEIYDLLITISGPEPQRTLFENHILEQLKTFSGKVFLTRGLPSEVNTPAVSSGSLQIENHLQSDELNRIVEQSKMIISRSGYTTVMDLALLKKKAVLIPTPGQTEQEYLAKYLAGKGYFFSIKQKDFSLKEALKKCESFQFKSIDFSSEEYKKVISKFVLSLKSGNFANQ
ncbi:MAG: glycosyltransferase, partial [Ginsengibacter sp.]